MNPAMPRLVGLACAMLAISGVARAEDEEAQIVMTCHYANAEWGNDAIHRCIDENRALREEVLRLPDAFARDIARCRANAELGWGWVKTCVEAEAAARAALAAYPGEARALVDACRRDVGGQGLVAVKKCVDQRMQKTPAQ